MLEESYMDLHEVINHSQLYNAVHLATKGWDAKGKKEKETDSGYVAWH